MVDDLFSRPLAAQLRINAPNKPCAVWGIEKSLIPPMAWQRLSKPRLIIMNPASFARISTALEIDSTRALRACNCADRLSSTR